MGRGGNAVHLARWVRFIFSPRQQSAEPGGFVLRRRCRARPGPHGPEIHVAKHCGGRCNSLAWPVLASGTRAVASFCAFTHRSLGGFVLSKSVERQSRHSPFPARRREG